MRRIACLRSWALVIIALLSVALPTSAQTAKLVTESYHVPARDPGIQLYLRNKRPEEMRQFSAERIVLFVHGATFPAESSFDLALGGLSWMDYIAQRGFDVYLMDLRGYGASTRPPEMSQPAAENQPIVNTEVAVRDVSAVVDHILARRGVSKINLLGFSWGTVLMAAYTAQNNEKVERLVLYAPVWLRTTPSLIATPGPLGAYRTVTKEAAEKRRRQGVPPEKQQVLQPAEWFDAWWRANLATDPVGAAQTPPVVRAPNGVVEDGRKYWSAGKPYYDASNITVPVQLILAEWDADTPLYMAQALFEKLTKAPLKRHVVIGEGTHGIMLERNRMQLFREVQLFLEESR
jgi:pimeloyl-ACP methyl ester carboxylesterase